MSIQTPNNQVVHDNCNGINSFKGMFYAAEQISGSTNQISVYLDRSISDNAKSLCERYRKLCDEKAKELGKVQIKNGAARFAACTTLCILNIATVGLVSLAFKIIGNNIQSHSFMLLIKATLYGSGVIEDVKNAIDIEKQKLKTLEDRASSDLENFNIKNVYTWLIDFNSWLIASDFKPFLAAHLSLKDIKARMEVMARVQKSIYDRRKVDREDMGKLLRARTMEGLMKNPNIEKTLKETKFYIDFFRTTGQGTIKIGNTEIYTRDYNDEEWRKNQFCHLLLETLQKNFSGNPETQINALINIMSCYRGQMLGRDFLDDVL